MNSNHPEDAEPGHWDDLATLLGVSGEEAPAAQATRTEKSHAPPSVSPAPAVPAEDEPQAACDLFAEVEEEEDAGPDDEQEAAAAPGEASEEPKKRRRRRRRRKKSEVPAEAAAVPSESAPVQEVDHEPEAIEHGEADEVEDVGDDDAGPVAEPVSEWNVPSWNEIIAGLYRPPDR